MRENKLLREFARYASWSVLGMLGLSCYILADTFFVARGLGSGGLAALNLAIPVYNLIAGTGLMLGMGGAIRYTICRSKSETAEADRMFTNTIYMGVIAAALFILAGVFCPDQITKALGADETVFAMTRVYLRTLCFFTPAFMVNSILQCFVRNDGAPHLAMAATVSGSLVNIVLDYLFIFPFNMGMFGAVLATGFSPVTGIFVMLPWWFGKRRGFHFTKTGMKLRLIRENLALGFPSLIGQLSSGITIITFNTIILRLQGNLGVAAYGVITNIALVVAAVYNGVAQGIQPLISDAYGRGRNKDAGRVLKYAMAAAVVTSVLTYGWLFVYAEPVAAVFNSENIPALQTMAVEGLKLYFLSNIFIGFNIILAMYFAATERVAPAQVLSLLRGVVLIVPAAFIMAFFWGMTGVWMAVPAVEAAISLLGAAVYRMYQNGG
ncbi:MAG: MATE family efflux transporter [Eubacteriales bacterium]|nr:MATE family efflux transporter [Eubacteriales bacterium]